MQKKLQWIRSDYLVEEECEGPIRVQSPELETQTLSHDILFFGTYRAATNLLIDEARHTPTSCCLYLYRAPMHKWLKPKNLRPLIPLPKSDSYTHPYLNSTKYRTMASVEVSQTPSTQPHANIKQSAHAHHHVATRQPSASTGDFDNAYPLEVRRYLRTYGMIPPVVDTYESQIQRCTDTPSHTQFFNFFPITDSS